MAETNIDGDWSVEEEGAGEEEEETLKINYGDGIFRSTERLIMFTCKKTRFVWDSQSSIWRRLCALDSGVHCDKLHSGGPLTSNQQELQRLLHGTNEINIPEKTILALLLLELLNPFYIFQLLSFTLWFLDNYYYYALAILAMSAAGVFTAVAQTRTNQHNLRSTVHSSDTALVQSKNGLSRLVPTETIVPGDIIEIPPHGCLMHCDAVLLAGNCIVNESMLTGESVPVTKTPLPNSATVTYDSREHARHTLFSGTRVIQTRYYGGEPVLAVAVRTGWSTSKGGLVRSILYPPPVDYRFERDSYRWVCLLAGVAGLGFLYTVVTKALRGISARDLVLEALDLVTIVVPPALPAAMTVGRLYAQQRLRADNIFCIAPRTINVSGSVDCVCFDKTGTLTEDGLDFLCVVPIRDMHYLDIPVRDLTGNMITRHPTLFYGMACCHSLTMIDGQLCGDPLDLKMFESTGWKIEEHDTDDSTKYNMMFPTVVKASTNVENSENQIGIIREFPFSSNSQRMGVVVRRLGGNHFEYYCKGSPEMLLNFCNSETVPDDFTHILAQYTQQGYRVIAIAHIELHMSYAKVQRLQRETIEKDLNLLGLIVLENRLKPETSHCISTLNKADIRCIMVTGDNMLTAVSVARECGILAPKQSVITVNVDSQENMYYTLANADQNLSNGNDISITDSASVVSLDTVESALESAPRTNVKTVKYNDYRLALTGRVWATIRDKQPELIGRLITRGAVFARMSPEQKQQLIEELQNLGYCVAMCGDGANDCGALRAAHAGISLSDAESSVASPFTSRTTNVSCVPAIIREGRAALVTSFGIFKYMAAYSLCQFVSVMILYSIDSNLTDIQYLYVDLFMISIFAFFFGRTRAYNGQLVRDTPLSSLVSVSPVLSLALQLALVTIFQVVALEHARTQSWFVPFNHSLKTDGEHPGCYENYAVFSVSSFQYVILAVAFSKGRPYRQSIITNHGFVLSAVVVCAFSAYLLLYPADWLRDAFELVIPPDIDFRLILLVYPFANFVLAMLVETLIIEHLVFKKLRFKWHNVDKSKRKYLAVERDLQRDVSWPMLTSDYKTSPSFESLSESPRCQAEIVVETENRFEKDHILSNVLPAKLRNSCDVLPSIKELPPRLCDSAPSVLHGLELETMHSPNNETTVQF